MNQGRFRRKQSGISWLCLSILVFLVDISIKFFIMDNMGYGWENRVEIFPFFDFLYIHNYGAAFGFLSDQNGWQRWLFIGSALIIIIILIYWVVFFNQSKWNNIAYSLIIGGALGNLLDRCIHGFVVDYLYFYLGNYHWPAFNFADSCIFIGVIIIILLDSFKKSY
ncbi:lipoprotein signal peptidase [Candidatus Photodesmus katoptron]|uniref:Lipoprotein signal peptidase n=1 Tax=Candidatus Photodesmus katoptron Akat1 TaxID=1236703 RepID=S3DI04_9GAMM|nr:signal peptidase II [Candidatus Photodesmus katoptron]EPE37305.1 lipoprotein signal peptidase [Candidatus Photodesmus katoptron Akat1]KEY90024.1 lipoprotein signal peptidase [Candidatus Photodesmus katoptron]